MRFRRGVLQRTSLQRLWIDAVAQPDRLRSVGRTRDTAICVMAIRWRCIIRRLAVAEEFAIVATAFSGAAA